MKFPFVNSRALLLLITIATATTIQALTTQEIRNKISNNALKLEDSSFRTQTDYIRTLFRKSAIILPNSLEVMFNSNLNKTARNAQTGDIIYLKNYKKQKNIYAVFIGPDQITYLNPKSRKVSISTLTVNELAGQSFFIKDMSEFLNYGHHEIPTTEVSSAERVSKEIVAEGSDALIRERILETAMKYIGTPYIYGGSSPGGFDCSGFVQYVYKKHNLVLPHSALQQYKLGTKIDRKSLKPGDLVFFATRRRGRVSHVVIYIGNDEFIHAPSRGKRITISKLSKEAYWSRRYIGARNIVSLIEN